MRWRSFKRGDTRVRSFYAWFPVYSLEMDEWRWLEWVTVHEVYECSLYGYSAFRSEWRIVEFIDDKQKPKIDAYPTIKVDETADWEPVK
jgi:hypothetical protein